MDISFISHLVNGVAIAFGCALALVGLLNKNPFERSAFIAVLLAVLPVVFYFSPIQDIRDTLPMFFLLVGLGGWMMGAGFRGVFLAGKRFGQWLKARNNKFA